MAKLPNTTKGIVLLGAIAILACLVVADLATRPHCVVMCTFRGTTHISLAAMADETKDGRVRQECMKACVSIRGPDVFGYLYEFVFQRKI
jgi:hypothetical protein